MLRNFTAVTRCEDDMFVADCPALEIASQGDSREQARANLCEAIEGFFEVASPAEIERMLHTSAQTATEIGAVEVELAA